MSRPTAIQYYDWIVAKSKRRLRNEKLTERSGLWLKRNKLYRAWKPAHEKAILKQRVKDNPEWGTW